MIIFFVICYVIILLLIYYVFKLFPYSLLHKIITIGVGLLLVTLLFTVSIIAPFSSNLFIEARVIPLSLPMAGRIESVVEAGANMKKGGILLQLVREPFLNKLHESEGDLLYAQAHYEREKVRYDYAVKLFNTDKQAISIDQFNNSEQSYRMSLGKLRVAESAVVSDKYKLENANVKAPEDGFVPFIAVGPGSLIKPDEPVLNFVSLQSVYPLATFKQNALAFVRKGDSAEIVLDLYPGRLYKANVEEIFWAAGEALVAESKNIPRLSDIVPPNSYLIKFSVFLPEEDIPLHFGARGKVVIYTDHYSSLHFIQRAYLKIRSWLDYLSF